MDRATHGAELRRLDRAGSHQRDRDLRQVEVELHPAADEERAGKEFAVLAVPHRDVECRQPNDDDHGSKIMEAWASSWARACRRPVLLHIRQMPNISNKVGEDERRFVEDVARLLTPWGVPPVAARLYGRLLLCPNSVGLDQITEDLGISKSSASVVARLLENPRCRAVIMPQVRSARFCFNREKHEMGLVLNLLAQTIVWFGLMGAIIFRCCRDDRLHRRVALSGRDDRHLSCIWVAHGACRSRLASGAPEAARAKGPTARGQAGPHPDPASHVWRDGTSWQRMLRAGTGR